MTTSKANRLTKAQNFKLYEWAKEKCSEGALHGMTDKAVAEMAGIDLEFQISESSVSDIRTDPDISITWRTSRDKEPEVVVSRDDMRIVLNTVLKMMATLNAAQIYINADSELGGLLERFDIPYFKASNGGAPLPRVTQYELGA